MRNNYFDEKGSYKVQSSLLSFLAREKMLCSFYRRKSFSEKKKGVKEFFGFHNFLTISDIMLVILCILMYGFLKPKKMYWDTF